MRTIFTSFTAVLLLSTAVFAGGESVDPQASKDTALLTLRVPLFSPLFARMPVAKVNDEQITVEELGKALGMMHAGAATTPTGTRRDYGKVLQRLVTTRLITQEARAMGMDELAEVRDLVDKFRESTLRELLRDQLVKDVTADEAEVEQLYRRSIREYTVRSLMFRKEADARALAQAVEAGGSFDDLSAEARRNGTARGMDDAETVQANDLNPAIAAALEQLKPGMASKPVAVQPGFVVLKLERERSVESAAAREEARQKVLTMNRHRALIEHNKMISQKYLTFNTKRLDSLDFAAAEPGIDKLLRDKRVLVQVKGGQSVTVSDLAKAMDEKLYHGSGKASKKINSKKRDTLEEVVARRMLLAEARQRGIDKTDAYREKVKEYEDNLLFGLFIQRVLGPDARPKEEEKRGYYNAHVTDYLASGRVRFESLAFTGKSNAEAARDKLKQGTELRWLRENAVGLADPAKGEAMEFGAEPVSLSELPPAMQTVLADARPGDVKIAVLSKGAAYVLVVQEVQDPQPQPFEAVQEEIGKKLFEENLKKALDTWAEKLKDGRDVIVYIAALEEH